MGYSKDDLLTQLKELQIDFLQCEHPPVLTVDAQSEYTASLGGALCKNLLLKDKKHRYYIVSALSDSKVDIKVLSQRLGLGKGGLRMAPQEALELILQVPQGCVTPFALFNQSARDVSLLLDTKLTSEHKCIFHPLTNDASIAALCSSDLDRFLKSIGRESIYVDFEACPVVGKDEPPDLAHVVPSPAVAADNNNASQGTSTGGGVTKSLHHANSSDKKLPASFADASKFSEEALNKMLKALHGLEAGGAEKCIRLELETMAVTFKNAAYAEGFHAGRHSVLSPYYRQQRQSSSPPDHGQ